MKKIKMVKPSFWISPQKNIFEIPIIKIISRLSHKRCTSGKISPYKDQSSLGKLKSLNKLNARQQSPRSVRNNKRNSPLKESPSRKQLNKISTNVIKNKKKIKKKISINKLNDLKGNLRFKAPKFFDNQIFRDVYDEKGNHDRVIETADITDSFSEIFYEENALFEDVLSISEEFSQKNKEDVINYEKLGRKQAENS